MTLFEKIATHEIPARIVCETADFIAFHDVNPQAPVHILIVPTRPIPRLAEAAPGDADLLGRMLLASGKIAADAGLAAGISWVAIFSNRVMRGRRRSRS